MSAGDGQPPLADTRGAREHANKRLQIQMRQGAYEIFDCFTSTHEFSYSCPFAAASKIATLARAYRHAIGKLIRAQLAKRSADNTGNRYERGGGSGGGRIRPYTLRSVLQGGVGEVFCQEEKQIPGGICRSRCSQTRDKQRVRSDDLPKTNGNQTRRPNCNVLPARVPTRQRPPPSVPLGRFSAAVP